MTGPAAARILVAHQHRLIGECLTAVLADAPDLGDVRLVTDLRDVPVELRTRPADVLIVRPGTPREHTADLCADIKEHHPSVRIVVLDDTPDPDLLLACVEAGADGYATFDEELSSLVETVQRARAGQTVVPPLMLGGLLERLIRRRRRAAEADRRFQALTPREREVLCLLAEGKDHSVIAEDLVISEHTARTHIQNLLGKLDVHSRVEAVALAVTSGWIDRDRLADAPR